MTRFRIAFENGLYIHQKMQTDMVFLHTFDTRRENRKFSLEMEDKTLRLSHVLAGPVLVLIIFLPFILILFLLELFHKIPVIDYGFKNKPRLFTKR